MKNKFKLWLLIGSATLINNVGAFCGFYVAKAGAELFNEKSEVIMVKDGNKMTITMSNDFKGSVKDFAMVVPVPTILQEKQIRIKNGNLFKVFNDYSAPRLVEYYDPSPCPIERNTYYYESVSDVQIASGANIILTDKKSSVKIEAQYQIGEYDILILSAKESGDLKTFLKDNGYHIPENAEEVLDPYIKNNLKFFVVKVNMDSYQKGQYQTLNPIQIEFESDKFMLPIRLGMANSTGEQDLLIYCITKTGMVETSNYRTVKMPTGNNIPTFVKNHFGEFYKDVFKRQYQNENKNAVFVEYAWEISPWQGVKCDPCVGSPPMYADLIEAGATWLNLNGVGSSPAYFTRLHVRYSRDKFPEDLTFISTMNKEHYQARYVITWPANGDNKCDEWNAYETKLTQRRKTEILELASITGWNSDEMASYLINGYDPIKNKIPRINEESSDDKKGLLPFFKIDKDKEGPWIFLLISLTFTLVFWMLKLKKKSAVV